MPLPSASVSGKMLTLAKVSTVRSTPMIKPGQKARWKLSGPAERSQPSRKMGASPMTIVPLIVVAAMLERALDAGVPCAWVTADTVYGADSTIRRWLERRRVGYVLAVTSTQRLWPGTVSDWLEEVPAAGWHRLSAGVGSKGPRLYDWAYLPFRGAPEGWRKGLLIRRRLGAPEDLAFYLTCAPHASGLEDLVRVAGARWTIESGFAMAKGEVGLDQYEVRSWTGWHRHITLAMLALAFLTVLRKAAIGGRGPQRLGRRSPAPDRAGTPSLALPAHHPEATRPRRRYRLVTLATKPSTAGATLSLETPNPSR